MNMTNMPNDVGLPHLLALLFIAILLYGVSQLRSSK